MTERICYKSCYNGSSKNGTIRETEILAAKKYGTYLCSAFETQVQDIEY